MRIILADHHAKPLRALKELLGEHPEFDVIGEAADGESLLAWAVENPADLILIDCDLPGIRIEELIAHIHAIQPRPLVIVMSGKLEKSRILFQSGADAYVSKSEQLDWLLQTLQHYERRKAGHQE